MNKEHRVFIVAGLSVAIIILMLWYFDREYKLKNAQKVYPSCTCKEVHSVCQCRMVEDTCKCEKVKEYP